MDDPASFILIVLFGVLGIFILVRLVKYASRTVDQEQRSKQGYPNTGPPNRSGAPPQKPKPAFCTQCGATLSSDGSMGIQAAPEPSGNKPKEVKLGMTPAEVEAVLGLPESKADLAEKGLYKYKNMTVEFHNGKVTDVR